MGPKGPSASRSGLDPESRTPVGATGRSPLRARQATFVGRDAHAPRVTAICAYRATSRRCGRPSLGEGEGQLPEWQAPTPDSVNRDCARPSVSGRCKLQEGLKCARNPCWQNRVTPVQECHPGPRIKSGAGSSRRRCLSRGLEALGRIIEVAIEGGGGDGHFPGNGSSRTVVRHEGGAR